MSCIKLGDVVPNFKYCSCVHLRTCRVGLGQSGMCVAQVTPDKTFQSVGLCRALYEVWLGEAAAIPDARASFAAGVAQLIETDEMQRGEWKPGGRGTDN
jgi:hypothetical protein